MNEQEFLMLKEEILSHIQSIIGDVPVSNQLSAALDHMADKSHKHDEYATKIELDALRKEIEKLNELIGDTSVSNQINNAINNK